MRMVHRFSLFTLLILLAGCAASPTVRAPTPLADEARLRALVEDVQLNDTLNPKLWQGDRLGPELRERLLALAGMFIEDMALGEIEVKDITFAGSNVGYLYHDQSDIDVHVSVDGSAVIEDPKLLFKLLNAMSDDWNSDFDFHMHGYEVELFMLDHRRKEGSAGVYSLKDERWITRPEKPTNVVNSDEVLADITRFAAEFEQLRGKFNASPESFDCQVFDIYRTKLKHYRSKQGFQRSGEYSVGNLGYKALRNGGYFDVAKAELARCLETKYNLD